MHGAQMPCSLQHSQNLRCMSRYRYLDTGIDLGWGPGLVGGGVGPSSALRNYCGAWKTEWIAGDRTAAKQRPHLPEF